MTTGTSHEDLDFASVQRGNPEMQRRCQEVIDQCWARGEDSPIVSIHDVGAGGLSNAVPEIINDAGLGGEFELRLIPNDQPDMSPMQIWCNEAQERYVLAVDDRHLDDFKKLCERERCLYAVIGQRHEGTAPHADRQTFRQPRRTGARPIDMDLSVLLGKPPRMQRDVKRLKRKLPAFKTKGIELARPLSGAAPANRGKQEFLVTIGDRSVTGLVCRDQMVGPWQIPLQTWPSPPSATTAYTGEAMSMGERTPLALLNPAASARMRSARRSPTWRPRALPNCRT